MPPEVAEVGRALLALSVHDRAAVIHAGLLSLDGSDDDDVDAARSSELDSRLGDVLHGAVDLGTFEQTYSTFSTKHPATAG